MNFFKSNSIFLIVIFMLILTGAAIFLNHQGFAAKLFAILFWILFLGVIIYILESRRNEE